MSLRFERILVTGAHGMLGQHLRIQLNDSNLPSSVTVLAPSRSELDLSSAEQVEEFIFKNKPDTVIHLAARVRGLQGNLNQPILSLIENEKIATILLDACFRNPPKQIFFAGTAASYGSPYEELPLKEKSFLRGDVHHSEYGYAWAKRAAFSRLKLLNQELGIKATYGILTNLYGPFDRFKGNETHVIPALIAKSSLARQSKIGTLHVWGNPNTTRDFMHAHDAARAIIHLLKEQNVDFKVTNICTGIETKISEVVMKLMDFYELSEVVWRQDKPVGISNRFLDNSYLLQSDFNLTFDLSRGLLDTIKWFEENAEASTR